MFRFTFSSENIDTENLYHQHQQIKALFSSSSKVLFRVDDDEVTVVTDQPPVRNLTCKCSTLTPKKSGEEMPFRLRANVKKREFGGDRKVKPITDFYAIAQWINGQGEKKGFKIVSIKNISPSYTTFIPKPENPIPYNTVDFAGVIKVTDPVSFNKACEEGINPGKSFGLGLLDIAI